VKENPLKWLVGALAGLTVIGVLVAALVVLWLMPVSRAEEPGDTVHLIPSDLRATLIDNGSAVELRWSSVEPEGVYLTVQRSRSGNEGSWEDLAELEPGATSFEDDEIETGGTYLYRLKAFTEDGSSGQTSVVSVTVP
jgi:hypothetical protein